MSLDTWKDIAAVAQGLGVFGAMVLGGAWTVHLFLRHREKYPRATIEHDVDVSQLGHDEIALRLAVTIRNVGRVLIKIDEGLARVQQLLPCSPAVIAQLKEKSEKTYPELNWPHLDEKQHENWGIELEPGEWEEVHFDFLIDGSVEKVAVYTHFRNEAKQPRFWRFWSRRREREPIGWNKTTMCCLSGQSHDPEGRVARTYEAKPGTRAETRTRT